MRAAVICALVAGAAAQTWNQLASVLVGRNTTGQAGQRVAVSGDGYTVAYLEVYDGSVRECPTSDDFKCYYFHVFDYDHGDGNWTDLGATLIDDTEIGSARSLAMSYDGSLVAVGNAETADTTLGKVTVYALNATSEVFEYASEIVGVAVGDSVGYGTSVAFNRDGTELYVGQPAGSDGAVVFYNTTNDTWTTAGIVEGEVTDAEFGTVVGAGQLNTSASRIIVCNSPGATTFLVTVYDVTATTQTEVWQHEFNKTALDVPACAISADGNAVVVGVPGASQNGTITGQGVVYAYTTNGNGTWYQRYDPVYGTPVENTGFGSSVAVNTDGSRIAVGSRGYTTQHADVYDGSGTTLTKVKGVTGTALGEAADERGVQVALGADGRVLVVAVPDAAPSATGTVTMYRESVAPRSNKLNGAQIAGIVIGSVLGAVLLGSIYMSFRGGTAQGDGSVRERLI